MEAISDTPKYGSLKEALIGIYGEDVRVKDRRAVHGGDANEAYSFGSSYLYAVVRTIERYSFFK